MPKRVLTYRRVEWVRSRKHTGVMRGKRLALPAGVAARYAAKIRKLSKEMTDTTRREVEALFAHKDVEAFFAKKSRPLALPAMDGFEIEYFRPTWDMWDGEWVQQAPIGWPQWTFAEDISPASQARILTNDLKRRFEQLFGAAAPDLGKQMVDEADDASADSLASSLTELSGGLRLNPAGISTAAMEEFKKSTVAAQVSLIKSIPEEYFLDVQQAVLNSIINGRGLADLTPFFEQQEGQQDRRSRNIALDQTHKAYNGLNTERMKAVGLNKFEWVHSGGGLHPRRQHQDDFNGKIYSFDKLPIDEGMKIPVKPGDAINCRCTMVPVIDFEDGEPK